MKIEVSEKGDLIIKDVYSGVTFQTEAGERFSICMRDGGFEFNYNGQWWRACQGQLKCLTDIPSPKKSKSQVDLYKNLLNQENYLRLLNSGMFWEFHPELSGDYLKDHKYMTNYIKEYDR